MTVHIMLFLSGEKFFAKNARGSPCDRCNGLIIYVRHKSWLHWHISFESIASYTDAKNCRSIFHTAKELNYKIWEQCRPANKDRGKKEDGAGEGGGGWVL